MLIFRNKKNIVFTLCNTITGLVFFSLLYSCGTSTKTKIKELEKRIKIATLGSTVDDYYPPPKDDYYLAMQEWTWLYLNHLSIEEQKLHISFIRREETLLIKSLYKSFMACVENTSDVIRQQLQDNYNHLSTDRSLEQSILNSQFKEQKETVFLWMMGVGDTATIFNNELDSLLRACEAENNFFQKNCKRWELHISYLQEQYGIEVQNLPCEIESIKKINGLKLLEKLEKALLEEFNDSLTVVLGRKPE